MSRFIAALPMYDWSEVRAETDAQWAGLRDGLRAAGVDAPDGLVRRNGDMPSVPGGIRDAAGLVVAPDPATLEPDELDLPTLWRHPALLFAQSCWGPMEMGLAGAVQVIGQPDYSAYEGGEGELYSSAVLMRAGDAASLREARSTLPPSGLPAISPARGQIGSFGVGDKLISPLVGEMAGRPEEGNVERKPYQGLPAPPEGRAILPLDLLRGRRFAYNSHDSMSGNLALERDLQAIGESLAVFSQRIETGSHRASIAAVAEGRADVCAIDCRSWYLAQRFEPAATRLTTVGWTGRQKALPFITSRTTPADVVAKLRVALGFGAWGSRRVDGLAYQDKIRSEW